MAINNEKKQQLVSHLMNDIGIDDLNYDTHELTETIQSILRDHNLSTDLTFIEKIQKLKFDKGDTFDIESLPKELKDAAFLPVQTVADIALRQDLDMIISQIPELYTAVQLSRDMICEADVVDGRLSRTIKFDHSRLSEDENDTVISKIEHMEDKHELHSIIRNQIVFDSLLYGESYLYAIPYAKVFSDLYKYRNSSKSNKGELNANLFNPSNTIDSFGYGESAVEVSLKDMTFIQETVDTQDGRKVSVKKHTPIFTKEEWEEIYPAYTENGSKDPNDLSKIYEGYADIATENTRYIEEDIAIPVIEHSEHDLKCVYNSKYKEDHPAWVQETQSIFEAVMNDGNPNPDDDEKDGIGSEFKNIKGVYLKIMPATKMIPIRLDRTIIGYYYISDMTRPEDQGERRNSGLGGYTLRSPSVGYDTFSPDRMFCEKLATKIISNFNLKFMRDNVALHDQIVAILQTHKFEEAILRFIFVPANHIVQFTINKDGNGKGHSMLEPSLVSARMYMFLKLYSVLFQINNSQIRVVNVRQSGLDKNYQRTVNNIIRKFTARRVTSNDIFNYRSSVTKVTGGSELVLPVGTQDIAPVTFETLPPADAPINNDMMELIKNETINAQPVPSAMIQGAMSEMEFAKEVELANTKLNSFISGVKLDLNADITKLYRLMCRWETDIDPVIIKDLKFMFKTSQRKELNVNNEMIGNFDSLRQLIAPMLLKKDELAMDGDSFSKVAQEFYKLLLAEWVPGLDPEKLEEMLKEARKRATQQKLEDANTEENITDDSLPAEGEELM